MLAYHSLEDRAVKRALAERAADTTPPGLPVSLPASRPQFRLLTRGAERPDAAELAANPRAASARLRAAERIRAGGMRTRASPAAVAARGADHEITDGGTAVRGHG